MCPRLGMRVSSGLVEVQVILLLEPPLLGWEGPPRVSRVTGQAGQLLHASPAV